MPTPYARLSGTRTWVKFLAILYILIGLVLALYGFCPDRAAPSNYTVGIFYVLAGVFVIAGGGLLLGLFALLFKIEADAYRFFELMIESNATQNQVAKMLGVIRDNSLISDTTKSITHRNMERDALRKAIREDILKEDWESAYSLIEDMEKRFGYLLEAYSYRKEVDEFRAKVIEDKLQTSLRYVRVLINEHKWDYARAEIDRVLKLAPDDSRVREVVDELTRKRDAYKENLLQQWHEAVEKKDLDRSIELIREIDPYLTREEAKKLEDSARSIFKAKLLDYGIKFREAVTDKRWKDAMDIGTHIRAEFPNSKMAQEVTESMEALKAKATASTPQ